MPNDTITLGALIIAGFLSLLWYINRQFSSHAKNDSQVTIIEWIKATQKDLQFLQSALTQTLQRSDKNVNDTLQRSYQELNTRLDNAAKVIGELKLETGKFTEIGRSMKALEDFLSSPKLRGTVGEQILNDLLSQVLPQQTFTLQHRFNSGDIVDALIKTHAGFIPIDAKFPMENYTKMTQAQTKKEQEVIKKVFITDVKKHIKSISQKYIKPDENTTDFALMYLPAESIYYEITANSISLDDYSRHHRVLSVSPATLYAFLRTILVSFEGQRLQEEASKILRSLRSIQHEASDFSSKLDTLSRHLTNAYNNMNTVSTDFTRLKSKIDNTRELGSGIKDKPPIRPGPDKKHLV